jgi:hypothetical protein
MLFQHFGKEGGAGGLVLRIEIPRPRQAVVKLRRRPDRISQDPRNALRRGSQIALRSGNFGVATFEKLSPAHQRRDQRGEQNQE